jgi:hypothetical protein
MPDVTFLDRLVDWIESHEKTVDLLKWLVLLLVAWAVGLFKWIRQKLRQPIATLQEETSRCFVEEFNEFEGKKNVVRASFLLEVGLTNTTPEPVHIRHFSLLVRRRTFWRPWRPRLSALSLPARPQHATGSSLRLLKNWFSNFPDQFRDLTLPGDVPPKQHQSAYLLFVHCGAGDAAARFYGDFIQVKALVHLTTGETRVVRGQIKFNRDAASFEAFVPGILVQVAHQSAWGTVHEA